MKINTITKLLISLALAITLLVVPGCCWKSCLKKCNSCNDCGVYHEKVQVREPFLEDTQEDVAPIENFIEED